MRIKFDRICLVYKYCFLFYVHISKKLNEIFFATIKSMRFFDVMKIMFDFQV